MMKSDGIGWLFGWWNRRPAGFLETETVPLPYFSNCRVKRQTGGTPVPLHNQMGWLFGWLFGWWNRRPAGLLQTKIVTP
jgi:hypothetical protein